MTGGAVQDLERAIELAARAQAHLLEQRTAVTKLDPDALGRSTEAQAALLAELAGCLQRCRALVAALPPADPRRRTLEGAMRRLHVLARLNGALIGDASAALAPIFGRDEKTTTYDRRARAVTAPPASGRTVL